MDGRAWPWIHRTEVLAGRVTQSLKLGRLVTKRLTSARPQCNDQALHDEIGMGAADGLRFLIKPNCKHVGSLRVQIFALNSTMLTGKPAVFLQCGGGISQQVRLLRAQQIAHSLGLVDLGRYNQGFVMLPTGLRNPACTKASKTLPAQSQSRMLFFFCRSVDSPRRLRTTREASVVLGPCILKNKKHVRGSRSTLAAPAYVTGARSGTATWTRNTRPPPSANRIISPSIQQAGAVVERNSHCKQFSARRFMHTIWIRA